MVHKFRQDHLSDFLKEKLKQLGWNKDKAENLHKDLSDTKEKVFFMNVENTSTRVERFLKKNGHTK